MKKNKGFTLIELLVVIAIIGILASVVLASLNSARNKGADAAVKSNLANTRAQAELFYDANGNSYYGTSAATQLCSASASLSSGAIVGINKFVSAAAKAVGISSVSSGTSTTTTAVCNASASAWAAAVPLKVPLTANYIYCVDSLGFAGEVAAGTISATDFNCQ